jgi:hypothetical protein
MDLRCTMKRVDGWIGLMRLLFIVGGIIMNAVVAAAEGAKHVVLSADLSGDQEVPRINTDAAGKAVFELSGDGRTLHYELTTSNLKDITEVHIHMAPAGQNGVVVVVLFDTSLNGEGRVEGNVLRGDITADDLVGPLVGNPLTALLREMEEAHAYINVHSMEYPVGHIRGQIIDPSRKE